VSAISGIDFNLYPSVVLLYLVVLPERIPFPIIGEEDSPEVTVTVKDDAEEVVGLPFVPVRPTPDVLNRREMRMISWERDFDDDPMAMDHRVEVVYDHHPVWRIIHTGKTHQGVKEEILMILQKGSNLCDDLRDYHDKRIRDISPVFKDLFTKGGFEMVINLFGGHFVKVM
jgi:hypothetical protein